MGDTPNIAARLQGLAAPNTVVLSAATARLVQRRLRWKTLGCTTSRGWRSRWRCIACSARRRRQSRRGGGRAGAGSRLLVGRDEEVGLLLRRWEQSKEGLGQVVLLSGEAGIGKSRLVQTLREHVGREGCARLTFRCSPYHTNSALYPVIAHLQRLLRWQRDETPEAKLAKLERCSTPLACPWQRSYRCSRRCSRYHCQRALCRPDAYPAAAAAADAGRPGGMAAGGGRAAAGAGGVGRSALGRPLDAGAAGPAPGQAPTVPMLTVLTFRPVFVPPWPSRSHLTPITLNRLRAPAGGGHDDAPGRRQGAASGGGASTLWPRPMACRCLSKS